MTDAGITDAGITDVRLSDAEVLTRCPLFATLPADELSALSGIAERRRHASGTLRSSPATCPRRCTSWSAAAFASRSRRLDRDGRWC